MSNELPILSDENSFAGFEIMDLSKLYDNNFLVAVSTNDRNSNKFLTSTVRGPYSFYEMCEQVGNMWEEFQHHAKVIMCNKDSKAPNSYLDAHTVDYIEYKYIDILMDGLLTDSLLKQYTCQANVLQDTEVVKSNKEADA